jgi:type I restriction enzyme, S subunit
VAVSVQRYGKYPTYKDSTVVWLGEIPAHWETAKLWQISQAKSGGTPPREVPGYWNGAVPWVSPKDMKRRSIDSSEEMITEHALMDSGLRLHEPPVVLIVVRGMILAHSFPVAITRVAVTINQDMKALTFSRAVDPQFAVRFFEGLGTAILESIVTEAAHGTKTVRMDSWRTVVVPIPSLAEQRAIVAHVDRETARIDALVAKKERLITLLQERRTSLITRAVTKGLDPAAPMKDSGVEWLGEIPAHWEVKKVKRLCLVKRGASPRPIDDPIYFDDEGEYAWVRIADVTASDRYLEHTTQRLSEYGKSLSVPLEPGELFVSIAGTVGKPIITRIKCCIHDGFVYFVNLRERREYMFYVFSCGEPYKGLGKMGTQLNLNTDTIGDIYLPRPSDAEQDEIADALDRESGRIDSLVARIRTAITRLDELRTALISAAVTGKIDVRENTA